MWLQSALVSPLIPTTACDIDHNYSSHYCHINFTVQLDPVKVFVALKYCNASATGSISHKSKLQRFCVQTNNINQKYFSEIKDA